MNQDAIVILACLCVLVVAKMVWTNRREAHKEALRAKRLEAAASGPEPEVKMPPVDPFLADIKRHRAEVETTTEQRLALHKAELAAKFSVDMALKKRLVTFAKEQGLDVALFALWREILPYPAWVKRPDFEQWNKLAVTEVVDVIDNTDSSPKEIAFTIDGINYSLHYSESSGYSEAFATLSLIERDRERFTVRASLGHDDAGTTYRTVSIEAFHKEGCWARMLLGSQAAVRAAREESSVTMNYHEADEIKDRFKDGD
jgi:hypothetical protein